MAMKKIIGKVTTQERDEIKKLFERKNSLRELSRVLDASNDALYEKMLLDAQETSIRYQNWWDEMGKKYGWESHIDGNWKIDFSSCTIYLITSE